MPFIYSHLHDIKNFPPTLIILFKINPLFIVKSFQVFLSNTNSFLYKLLSGFKYCYLALIIKFDIKVVGVFYNPSRLSLWSSW